MRKLTVSVFSTSLTLAFLVGHSRDPEAAEEVLAGEGERPRGPRRRPSPPSARRSPKLTLFPTGRVSSLPSSTTGRQTHLGRSYRQGRIGNTINARKHRPHALFSCLWNEDVGRSGQVFVAQAPYPERGWRGFGIDRGIFLLSNTRSSQNALSVYAFPLSYVPRRPFRPPRRRV